MKLAVISDIHSNHFALEACMNQMERERIDGVILLGDYVSDCPYPQITLDLIRKICSKYRTWMVKGNREEYFISHANGKEDGWVYEANTGSLLYTYENLKNEDITWFDEMPNTLVVEIEGTAPILIAHASIHDSRELLYAGEDNTNSLLESMGYDYLISGHTHRQILYRHKGKTFMNPGSVGVPIGSKSSAHMAMLEWFDGKWEMDFQTIPYNYECLKKEFYASEMKQKAYLWMCCILKSIEDGVNYAPRCIKRAYDIARNELDDVSFSNIPSCYWNEAAKQLGLIC
ncbi:MAG TPA: YfcE family phosphodiesterase [Lachnospiraceae bacterium]|nr:YfcE family phosphodiesterase [Lachnospiraceae bacterium]